MYTSVVLSQATSARRRRAPTATQPRKLPPRSLPRHICTDSHTQYTPLPNNQYFSRSRQNATKFGIISPARARR